MKLFDRYVELIWTFDNTWRPALTRGLTILLTIGSGFITGSFIK